MTAARNALLYLILITIAKEQSNQACETKC